jgi:16S rRNA processing protein RimM
LPELAEEEFYYADLVGLAAEDLHGTPLGTIVAVHNFGAGDLLELKPANGGDTVMLPFTAETTPSIDVAAGRIVLDPPQAVESDDREGAE